MGRSQRDESHNIVGTITTDSTRTVANGSENITISNVGNSGIGTATISKWLRMDIDGTTYYIPLWT